MRSASVKALTSGALVKAFTKSTRAGELFGCYRVTWIEPYRTAWQRVVNVYFHARSR